MPALRCRIRCFTAPFGIWLKISGTRRKKAIATVDDWEGLRDRARAIKDETLLHLDTYLEQFAANAENAGAVVHWARDA